MSNFLLHQALGTSSEPKNKDYYIDRERRQGFAHIYHNARIWSSVSGQVRDARSLEMDIGDQIAGSLGWR